MPLPPLTFTGICVETVDRFFVTAVIDELANDKVDHTVLLSFSEGTWTSGMFSKHICGLVLNATVESELMCVSVDGDVHTISNSGKSKHRIDTSEQGPSRLVNLCVVRRIGESMFAAGMAQRVYRRVDPVSWEAFDAGVFVPREERTEPCGFLALAGSSEDHLCAAGLRGRIWTRGRDGWEENCSPTKVALTAVDLMSDGRFCVGGLLGTVLLGRPGAWSVLDHGETNDDFWGCATFGGKTYLATYKGIYCLSDDQSQLLPIELWDGSPPSTAVLHVAGDSLWSIGQKDLSYSRDGEVWQSVQPEVD